MKPNPHKASAAIVAITRLGTVVTVPLICTFTRRIPTGFARRVKSLSPRQGLAWRRWQLPTTIRCPPWRRPDQRRSGGALN